jgi:hypothetical protein
MLNISVETKVYRYLSILLAPHNISQNYVLYKKIINHVFIIYYSLWNIAWYLDTVLACQHAPSYWNLHREHYRYCCHFSSHCSKESR